MKKDTLFLCIAAFFFLFSVTPEVIADMRIAPAQKPAVSQVPSAPSVKPLPPDLTVTAKYAYMGPSYTRADGTKCYTPRPRFTITNQGHSDANNFEYYIEWTPPNWQPHSSNNIGNLKAGQTITIDGNDASWDWPWCASTPDQIPGFRISVDTKNTVAESNENNNVAAIFFDPSTIRKVPETIRETKPFTMYPKPEPPENEPQAVSPASKKQFDPQPEPPVKKPPTVLPGSGTMGR